MNLFISQIIYNDATRAMLFSFFTSCLENDPVIKENDWD